MFNYVSYKINTNMSNNKMNNYMIIFGGIVVCISYYALLVYNSAIYTIIGGLSYICFRIVLIAGLTMIIAIVAVLWPIFFTIGFFRELLPIIYVYLCEVQTFTYSTVVYVYDECSTCSFSRLTDTFNWH